MRRDPAVAAAVARALAAAIAAVVEAQGAVFGQGTAPITMTAGEEKAISARA